MNTAPTMPHDLAAERAVLGQAIGYPEHCDAILRAVKLEFLYRRWHQNILKAVVSIRAAGQCASLIGVRDWLVQSGVMSADDGKGMADLSEIAANAMPFYVAREVEIIQRAYHHRLHIALAAKNYARAQEPCVTHDDLKQAVLDGLEGYEQLFGEVLPNAKLPVG
jgi:replicative DNA helicase